MYYFNFFVCICSLKSKRTSGPWKLDLWRGCWERNSCCLEEPQGLFTTEPPTFQIFKLLFLFPPQLLSQGLLLTNYIIQHFNILDLNHHVWNCSEYAHSIEWDLCLVGCVGRDATCVYERFGVLSVTSDHYV